jgi:leucyl aminopeptidase
MPAIIQFTKSCSKTIDTIVVPIVDGKTASLKDCVSASVLKKIKSCIAEKGGSFDGKQGSCAQFSSNDKDKFTTYILVAIDKGAAALDIEKVGGKLCAYLSVNKIKAAGVLDVLKAEDAAALANGFYLRSYKFMKYKTGDKAKTQDITLKIACDKKANADREFVKMKSISDAVFFARDVVSEPPNALYPESYAKEITKTLRGSGVKITVLDDKKLDKMGAGALMAVGKGSDRKPRLVIVEYDGRAKKVKGAKPIALVGKGVTYDTGGYSLKPGGSMEKMKMDMGGSAAMIGTVKALAANKVDTYVVAVVALAENMINGNAYRVDDVLTSLSGKTIEVINTDAEGRLCLADALTYVQDKYDPSVVVDAATLTGACMGALGTDMAGVFSNDKNLETSFWKNGDVTGDHFWPLPVNDDFDKQIESPIADMRNLGLSRLGGASTAAVFLRRFITNNRPWAHLDIAGTAWAEKDYDLVPKGASGFGVRALYHWVSNYK